MTSEFQLAVNWPQVEAKQSPPRVIWIRTCKEPNYFIAVRNRLCLPFTITRTTHCFFRVIACLVVESQTTDGMPLVDIGTDLSNSFCRVETKSWKIAYSIFGGFGLKKAAGESFCELELHSFKPVFSFVVYSLNFDCLPSQEFWHVTKFRILVFRFKAVISKRYRLHTLENLSRLLSYCLIFVF